MLEMADLLKEKRRLEAYHDKSEKGQKKIAKI